MKKLKLNLLTILILCLVISCKRTTKLETVSNDEESEQKIYTKPDYDRLGYTEIPFNGWASQAEMNSNEYENVQRAKKRMSTILDSIHILYNKENWEPKQKEIFFKTLELSQQQWMTYYETMLDLKFPNDTEYGSSFGMVSSSYIIKLINQRIRDLNPWLMGLPQGDISGGTIRTLDYSLGDIERSQEKKSE
jgi:hypothetical protein